MNSELEAKVPVAEQLKEIEAVDEAIATEYTLNPDGSVELEGEATETA